MPSPARTVRRQLHPFVGRLPTTMAFAVALVSAAAACGPTTGPAIVGAPASTPATASPSSSLGGVLAPVGAAPASSAASASPAGVWPVPNGRGTIVRMKMKPPPWTGGRDPYATLEVYLPPGYDTSPARRYPVLYEVPWTFESWQEAIGIESMLDLLIDAGRIRPFIVVFAAHNGAPYADSECVDSVDGRQRIETYITTTVVPYVDATYRTIPDPGARGLFGFSQGGFCAPMLLLRHPDIFGEAIALSGYFQAGIRTRVTPDAWRPFGGDATAIAEHSPLGLAGTVPAASRGRLFVVLSADPGEWLYGPQYQRFASVLQADGYPLVLLPSASGHTWPGVRATVPLALAALSRHWAALGVG